MTKRSKNVKIFCGSDSSDEEQVKRVKTHLSPLLRSDQVTIWYEQELLPGAHRQQENEGHLKEANIVLLLLSPDFLESHGDQIEHIMDLHKAGKISSVIPILLRYSSWEESSLKGLQALPRDKTPIHSSDDKDKALWLVTQEIKELVGHLLDEPQQQSDVKDGFLFIGQSPANGYRWDDNLRLAPGAVPQQTMSYAPWLVSEAVGRWELSRRYALFSEKNVLRDFITLSPTPEAIQHFANRYGHLAEDDLFPLSYPDGKPDPFLWVGESLQFWREEISDMKKLVTIWDMIKEKQREALKEHIVWNLDPMYVKCVWQNPGTPLPSQSIIASEKISPKLFYQWEWGEILRPALSYLCREINEQVRGHINLTLFPSSEVEMYMVPDGLRSALYLLLALEIRDYTIEGA